MIYRAAFDNAAVDWLYSYSGGNCASNHIQHGCTGNAPRHPSEVADL